MHEFVAQMDGNTIAAFLALIGSIAALIVSYYKWHRDRDISNADDMAHAQGQLEQQIKELNERLNRLYDSNGELRGLVRELRGLVKAYSEHDIEQVEYIREVGHWMAQACAAMDVDQVWLKQHPKPHLPESTRHLLPKDKQHLKGTNDDTDKS